MGTCTDRRDGLLDGSSRNVRLGVMLVLGTPLAATAMALMPWVVATTAVFSIPISWMIAPRLRARYWREKGLKSDIISGPNFESPF